MKTVLCIVAILALAGCALSQDGPKAKCEGARDISCNAYATLEIISTGGTCTGSAGADCTAVGSSQSKYKEAYDEWWGGGEGVLCDEGKARAAAEAVAVAIAEVWTNAQAKVSCDGFGSACGYSITSGTAFGLAMAEALAQAAADASVAGVSDAFCYADVRAVSSALAEAAGKASAAACVKNSGTLEDWQSSYVSAITEAIASAHATAAASACADSAEEVTATSKCTGKATSDQQGEVIIEAEPGDACGGVSEIPVCAGPNLDPCCSGDFRGGWCKCKDCRGDDRWIKKSKQGDLKRIWEDKESKLCFCLDAEDTGDGEGGEADTSSEGEEETETAPVEPAPVEPETSSEGEEETETAPVEPAPVEPETPSEGEETETTPAEAEEPKSICDSSADISCNAFATLEILALKGTCSGEAGATCEAYSSSVSEFKEAYDEWWKEDGASCDEGKVETMANAVGLAIASVFASASAKVKCVAEDGKPQGFACGWSAAGGKSWSVAFAEALAQAAADATDPHGQADAFCYADVRAVSAAIADAVAQAQSEACSSGQAVEDYQESLAESISTAIATATATATAQACNKGEEVIAKSKCSGTATSDQVEDKYVTGDACADAAQVDACTGAAIEKCCERGWNGRLCDCRADGCEGDRWRLISDYSEDGSRRSFKPVRGGSTSCFCL